MKTLISYLLAILSTTAMAQVEMLLDLNPGNFNSSPVWLTVVGDHLYFRANNGQSGHSLFKTDGTAEGTALVFTPPMLGGTNNGPIHISAFDGHVLFHHFNWQQMLMYLSDGTAEGTVVVSDPDLGSATSLYHPLSDFGHHFTADNGARYFYRLEPGTHERVPLTGPEFPNGVSATLSFQFRSCGNRVYFTASDFTHGHEPHYSDGTHEGTFRIADLNPGSAGSWPRNYTCFDEGLLFTAEVGGTKPALYRWDGPGNLIELVKVINENVDAFSGWASGQGMHRLANGIFIFPANDGIHGTELWRTDGTTEGTYMVKDINPGSASSMDWPVALEEFFFPVADNSQAIYYGFDDTSGLEWFITDGTAEGTHLLIDLNPGSASSMGLSRLAHDGKVYFAGRSPSANRELFVTDGTPEGTVQLSNIRDGQGNANVTELTHFNNRLYFSADDGVHGRELWVLDLGTLSVEPSVHRGFEFASYPNPVVDMLSLQFPQAAEGVYQLHIMDVQGRVVQEYSSFAGGAIDVSPLPVGMYLLSARDAQGRAGVQKFVKEK